MLCPFILHPFSRENLMNMISDPKIMQILSWGFLLRTGSLTHRKTVCKFPGVCKEQWFSRSSEHMLRPQPCMAVETSNGGSRQQWLEPRFNMIQHLCLVTLLFTSCPSKSNTKDIATMHLLYFALRIASAGVWRTDGCKDGKGQGTEDTRMLDRQDNGQHNEGSLWSRCMCLLFERRVRPVASPDRKKAGDSLRQDPFLFRECPGVLCQRKIL